MKKLMLGCLLLGLALVMPPALWAGSALDQADAVYD